MKIRIGDILKFKGPSKKYDETYYQNGKLYRVVGVDGHSFQIAHDPQYWDYATSREYFERTWFKDYVKFVEQL